MKNLKQLIISDLTRYGGGNLPYISVIRLIAMLFIVFCHILQFYGNILAWEFNVGVQMFFILSGFLYGNKKIEKPISWFLKNAYKILLPYYLFLLFGIVISFFLSQNSLSIVCVIKSVFCVGTIKGLGHLWFVGYIIFCYLLTPYLTLLVDFLKNKSLTSSLIICVFCLLIYYVLGILTRSYFSPNMILCYFIGYLTSFFINTYGKVILKYILFFSIPITIITKIVKFYGIGIGSFYIHAISHIFLAIVLVFGLMELFQNIRYKFFLRFSDKYSYCIYLVHLLFILGPLSMMTLTPFVIVNYSLIFMAIVFGGMLLQFTTKQVDYCLEWLGIKKFIRKYII